MNKHKQKYKIGSLIFLPFVLLETYFSSKWHDNEIIFCHYLLDIIDVDYVPVELKKITITDSVLQRNCWALILWKPNLCKFFQILQQELLCSIFSFSFSSNFESSISSPVCIHSISHSTVQTVCNAYSSSRCQKMCTLTRKYIIHILQREFSKLSVINLIEVYLYQIVIVPVI